MPIQVLMPALSPTMTEGTVANWLKSEGEEISSGDVLCEIETDKATMEVEAADDGVLGKIVVDGGTEDVAVNSLIGIILEEGEDISALDSIDTTIPATSAETDKKLGPSALKEPTIRPVSSPTDVSVTTQVGSESTFSSPVARRLAAQKGIDLNLINGSGPRGRVIKRDVEIAVIDGDKTQKSSAQEAAENPASGVSILAAQDPVLAFMPEFTTLPHSPMRRVIAHRLTEAARDVPHFNINVDVEIDELLRVRNQLNSRENANYKISVNDIVIKSVALALELQPSCNVAFMEDAILEFKRVDVAIAVAVEGGLITPIIKDAGEKGLRAISDAAAELAVKAREGKLQPDEYQGGTFTVSNLGMFGVKSFNSIINSPHGGILSVGAGEQRPVVKNGALAIATVMSLTLAFDHRCIDGATAAAFIRELKGLLENPIQLML